MKLKLVVVIFISIISLESPCQYVSPFVYENGTFRNKTRSEIGRDEANNEKNKTTTPKEFAKPKKEANSRGEIWIDGYCRYRPPSSSLQRFYYDLTEIGYLTPVFPTDTVRYADDFSGKGNIAWDDIKKSSYKSDAEYKDLNAQIAANLNEGIPVPLFQKLMKSSTFSEATESMGKYQFSRSISVWIKRISGSEKMDLEFSTDYVFCMSSDRTILKINDNGSYEINDNCDNCKHTRNDLKSGKVKSWVKGGWNEVGISKDEFNTVKIHINGEEVLQYQIPNVPVAVRYAYFNIAMPYEWQKKKLMYNVGLVTIENYPKKN